MEISLLGYILIFTFLGSIVSLIGGIILLLKENFAVKFSKYLASFAAGTLLGTAFLELLPEAAHLGEEAESDVFLWGLLGVIFFFLIDRFIRWFHHHHFMFHPQFEDRQVKPTVPLVVIGDSIHNFIDGVAIAASFMISIPLGILTTFAVASHEIPQEIGDFGILLHRGVKKTRVLIYNVISALMAIVGALITFYLGDAITGFLPMILAFTAGLFIYIAASDLIPEIHHEHDNKFAYTESMLLLIGVLVIYLATLLLEH